MVFMALFLLVLESVGHHELGKALPPFEDGAYEKWRQRRSVQTAHVNLFLQLISLQLQ